MNPIIITAALVRFFGITYLFGALQIASYIPERLAMLSHGARLPMTGQTAFVGLLDEAARIFLHLVFAAGLWIFAVPIAKFIAKSLKIQEGA